MGGRCYWPPVLPHEIVVLELDGRVKIRDDACETGCRTGERGWRRAVEWADYTVSLTDVIGTGSRRAEAGSLAEARNRGWLHSEGKEYVVAEGDVMESEPTRPEAIV